MGKWDGEVWIGNLEIKECNKKDFRYHSLTYMFETYKVTTTGEKFVRIDVKI